MDKNQSCQLYKYQNDFFLATSDTAAHFAQEFHLNELDNNYVSWLNFHGLKDQDSIKKLCQNLAIDPLTIEDIFTEKFILRQRESQYFRNERGSIF